MGEDVMETILFVWLALGVPSPMGPVAEGVRPTDSRQVAVFRTFHECVAFAEQALGYYKDRGIVGYSCEGTNELSFD